jgi:hypothetical protein
MLSIKAQSKTNSNGYVRNYFNHLFIKKRELVKLELDLIPQVRADWQHILGRTVTDRPQAEISIKNCYRYAGLNPPSIMWVDHPLNTIKVLINRPDLCDISGQIIQEIWQSELEIQRAIEPKSAAYVLANINPKHIIKTPIGSRQIESITDRLNDLVATHANALYYELTERTIPTPLQDFHIGDLGYFDYFLRIGLDIPRIEPAIDLAKSCGWCWAFENLAILTPKPDKVKIDRQGKIMGIIYNGIDILSDSKQTAELRYFNLK